MCFREKTAWISMSSIFGIYGLYFWSVIRSGWLATGVHLSNLIITVIALIIVQIFLIILVAIAAPKDAQAPRDERERLIELRATRAAYAVLASCLACACFFVPPFNFNANALLLVLVAAELLRASSQIVQFRRSA